MNTEQGSAQVRRSREDVVATALALLDRYGLPDLSMRRLAAELGVQPSALYWHVPNKQTLLALVADRIITRVPPVVGEATWQRALSAEAHALRDSLLAYRDGAEVVSSTLALGLGAEEARGRLRSAVAASGLGPDVNEPAADMLLDYIVGHAFHEQQRMQADSLGVAAPPRSLDTETGGGRRPADPFGFGIELVTAGLERIRAAAAQETPQTLL